MDDPYAKHTCTGKPYTCVDKTLIKKYWVKKHIITSNMGTREVF